MKSPKKSTRTNVVNIADVRTAAIAADKIIDRIMHRTDYSIDAVQALIPVCLKLPVERLAADILELPRTRSNNRERNLALAAALLDKVVGMKLCA